MRSCGVPCNIPCVTLYFLGIYRASDKWDISWHATKNCCTTVLYRAIQNVVAHTVNTVGWNIIWYTTSLLNPDWLYLLWYRINCDIKSKNWLLTHKWHKRSISNGRHFHQYWSLHPPQTDDKECILCQNVLGNRQDKNTGCFAQRIPHLLSLGYTLVKQKQDQIN